MEVSAMETPRRSSDSSSPEFEFWMVGSHPQPHLLTADELFVDGVLLPLHHLSLPFSEPEPEPEPEPKPAPDPPPANPSASICSAATPPSASKRWRDIFKVGEKKSEEKDRRADRKGGAGGSAELNINIWPFSRSRSAGNGGAASRPRASMSGRKASSAPCSRSNSRGESSKPTASATRRWAPSPGRAGLSNGVHLGRTSPVWHLPRTAKGGDAAARGLEKANGGGRKGRGGGGVRVLSLNVNTCIGYRNEMSCRGDENDGITGGARSREGSDGTLFNLRTFFTKKVY